MEIALGHGESLLSASGPRDFCDLGHCMPFILDHTLTAYNWLLLTN